MTLAYYAGTRLKTTTFDELFAQAPRTFIKTADQLYNTLTTFQNDEHLTCSLQANSTYRVTMGLVMSGTDGDLKTMWSAPSDATGYKLCQGPTVTSTDREDTNMVSAAHLFTTSRSYGVHSTSLYSCAIEEGLVVTITAGTLTLQHAQASSTGNNSGLVTNSFMTVTKIA